MTRVKTLSVLVAVGLLSVSLKAAVQQRAGGPPAPMVVEVQKLKDNLFVLTGGGGNTAVFVQTNGVTVVDTKNPGWGQPILAKIKELTNKPVTMIINTHTHGDHVSGNVAFPAKVEIVTHANTRLNMDKMKIFGESKGDGLPTRTFADYVGARRRRGSGRASVLRPWPHERRCVGVLPGAARDARRRHLPGQVAAAARRQQRRQWRWTCRERCRGRTRRLATWTPSSPATARS